MTTNDTTDGRLTDTVESGAEVDDSKFGRSPWRPLSWRNRPKPSVSPDQGWSPKGESNP